MSVGKEFEGKIAVVTGGSRGIGRAICLRLGALGAYVFVNYASSEGAAREVVDEIAAAGGSAELCPFDVSDSEAASSAIKAIIKEKGAVHILINNAGITRDGLLARMKQEDWDKVMSVNLKGAFICTQAALM